MFVFLFLGGFGKVGRFQMNRTLNVSAQTGKVDFRSSQQYAPCAFCSCPLQARRKATAPFT